MKPKAELLLIEDDLKRDVVKLDEDPPPDKDLPQLLNQEQHDALDELKIELSNLRDVNKKYAKFVLTVSNLYNSFLERIVPTEMQGYNKVASKNPSILEVRV